MEGLLMDTETMDLATTANGRLVVGDTAPQNKYLLLTLQKGAIKRSPNRCVGVSSFLETDSVTNLLREVRKEYTADGMKVKSVGITGEDLAIDADY